MFIDGKQILSNPGLHGPLEKCVTVEVTKVDIFFSWEELEKKSIACIIDMFFYRRVYTRLQPMCLRLGAEFIL
jgi:hypothetical protein